MMGSLREWCKTPIVIATTAGYLPNGEPNVTISNTIKCYIADELVNIIDNEGHEVLSATQLYTFGTSKVGILDQVNLRGETYTIKKIREFYDGNTGLVDIKVVYL